MTNTDTDSGYQGPDMILQFLSGQQVVSTEQALAFYHQEKSKLWIATDSQVCAIFDLQKLIMV